MLARNAIKSSSTKWVCPECTFRRVIPLQRPRSYSVAKVHCSRPYAKQDGQSRLLKATGKCLRDIESVDRWPSIQSTRNFSAVPTPRPAQSINSPSPIPQSTLGLHSALRNLELQAANYISLARVKLAIKSVEAGLQGTTRIAVLATSPNGKQDVERLLRVLLADVLGAEKEWEKQLLENKDGRAVLIKYGQSNIEQDFWNGLLRTVYVESPLLKNRGVEILISIMDVHVGSATVSATTSQRSVLDTFLVPMAEAAATQDGDGLSVVFYPVHKTILVAGGLGELVELGRFEVGIGGRVPNVTEMVKVVVNSTGISTTDDICAVDIAEAEKGISAFRADLSKSIEYEHAWFKSGIPELSTWIFGDDPKAKDSRLKREIKVFIEALLSDATARIDATESALESKHEASDYIATTVRNDLIQSSEIWERRAHEELQSSLEDVFHSPMWKKLAWWKLLWRVDDIGMIGLDVLRNHWLVRAEKELIYLFGRMNEANLLDGNSSLLSAPTAPEVPSDSIGNNQPTQTASPSPLPPTSASLYPDLPPLATTPSATTPYPTQITSARDALTKSLLTLQAKAQSLLLASLTTSSVGAALAALVQISSPLISFYESGAVAAFGVALAAVRLQNGWDMARRKFEDTVRETGRTALISTGGVVKEVVVAGGKAKKTDLAEIEMEQIREARKAVEGVRDALSIMGEK